MRHHGGLGGERGQEGRKNGVGESLTLPSHGAKYLVLGHDGGEWRGVLRSPLFHFQYIRGVLLLLDHFLRPSFRRRQEPSTESTCVTMTGDAPSTGPSLFFRLTTCGT